MYHPACSRHLTRKAHGEGRIRTFEGLRRQIYSLILLATQEPHPFISRSGVMTTLDLAPEELTARVELATA